MFVLIKLLIDPSTAKTCLLNFSAAFSVRFVGRAPFNASKELVVMEMGSSS